VQKQKQKKERNRSMSNEARAALLDPLTPENAVLLLVDQQEGWFSRIVEPEQTRHHLLGLARGAKLLGVPTVLTTNMAAGFNGPQVQALTDIFSSQEVLDRTVINAWQDPRVHEAIRRTGRTKVIIAGTATAPLSSSMPLAASSRCP
jgi:nicotinamidase-related amidase